MAGDGDKPPWGFLANIKLMALAAADDRLSRRDLQAFIILASHANQDGFCFLRMKTIAHKLGVKLTCPP
jgi:hypothetical protein